MSSNAFKFSGLLRRGMVPASVSSRAFSSRLFSTVVDEQLSAALKTTHPNRNITPNILEKVGRNLHLIDKHPLGIIKGKIEEYFHKYTADKGQNKFEVFDNLSPYVNTKNCFDDLRVGPDHVSRRPSDTYYIDDKHVLRTHTSAHQSTLISGGKTAFLCTGDVYRRDEIDASHYPVFHQMEGVRIFADNELPAGCSKAEAKKAIEDDLKGVLTGLARHLFGDVEMRWREDYFPFTEPSFELDIYFNDDWMEVLGCGVIHDEVMANAGQPADRYGWAFGLGLERLAMVLFAIPDIRLFWSDDERFTSQFQAGTITKFNSYSKFPLCYKDVSFWLPESGLHPNDVYEVHNYTTTSLSLSLSASVTDMVAVMIAQTPLTAIILCSLTHY
jgi:phenylalanyl-tRNA synthetase alpha chain